MTRTAIASLLAAAFVLNAGAASASEFDDQTAMCAAAADAQGIAAASDYRAKFQKSKGASTKTVTVELIPMVAGVEVIVAECQIKRGEVVGVVVKA